MKQEKIIGVLIGLISALIGGWDLTIQVLLIFVFVDISTGLLNALKGCNFTSRRFREGLVTKAGYILVLIVCYQFDTLAGFQDPYVRTTGAIFYIAVEGSSVIENLGLIGVPIPQFIAKRLAQLKDLANNGEMPKEKNETLKP